MNPYQTTHQTWNKIAQAYEDKFMDLDLYNDTYTQFCERIKKKGAKILEIGCGPGNLTKHLVAQSPDFDMLAIDVAPNMIALAQKNVPTAQFQVMDARDIRQIKKQFDAVICGFCMPYLSKEAVVNLFKDAAALLVEKGVFYCSTIEGPYEQSGYETGSTGDQAYVYYYQENELKKWLAENGFEQIEIVRKNYSKNDETTQVHLICLARKTLYL